MKILLMILAVLVPYLAIGQEKVIKLSPPYTIDAIPSGVVKTSPGVTYDAILAPKTNLVAYWKKSFGIEIDSTIILVNTLYQPVDTIKLSSVDWDITNKNIGIPLKTAATFTMQSTNAIDTAFWNHDIYPTTVFQNIDYDSTTYFKVADHVLNADSTELYPARITEIAFYSEATDAVAYFNVPAIPAGVKWVDKHYIGGANDGNYATPYVSIEAAYKALAAGTPIIVKSGIYTEEYNETTIRYLYMDKANTNISAIGNVVLRSVNTTYQARFILASTHTINRIVFDGDGTDTYNINANIADMTVNLNNCVFKSVTTGGSINTTANATVQLFNINKCVSLNLTTYDINSLDGSKITESYVNNVWNAKTKFYYNSLSIDGTVNFNSGCLLKYNYVNCGKLTSSFAAYNATGNYYIDHNYFDFTFVDGGSNVAVITNPLASSQSIPNINNNIFVSTDTGTLARACYYVYLAYGKTPKIKKNIFISKAKSIFSSVRTILSDSVIGKCEIDSNYFSSLTLTDAIISLGGEVLKQNKYNNSTFIGNTVTGHLSQMPTTTATTHAILLNGGVNFDVQRNYIAYTHLGLVVKAGAEQSYDTNGVANNVFYNNNRSLWIRGVKDLSVYNNTFVKTTTYDPYGGGIIAMDENSAGVGDQYTKRVTIRNCIIYSVNNSVKLYMDQTAADSACTVQNSLIWNDAADILNVASTGYTLSEANTASIITNSVQQTPNLTSSTILCPITPFTGADLGSPYNIGLDISTTWGSSTTVPNVVTKQQGATWQIGAYIQ